MAHDVFISHCNQDKPYADAICAKLEEAGIRCWIAPRDIIPGKEWGEEIIRGISESRVMVVVFSSTTNASKHVAREVERAIHKGCAIVPFRIEEAEPKGAMEYYLSSPHWLDAWTPPLEQHLLKLRTIVTALIPPEERQGPPPKMATPKVAPPTLPIAPVPLSHPHPAGQPSFFKKNLGWLIFSVIVMFLSFIVIVADAVSNANKTSTGTIPLSDTTSTGGGSNLSDSGYSTSGTTGSYTSSTSSSDLTGGSTIYPTDTGNSTGSSDTGYSTASTSGGTDPYPGGSMGSDSAGSTGYSDASSTSTEGDPPAPSSDAASNSSTASGDPYQYGGDDNKTSSSSTTG